MLNLLTNLILVALGATIVYCIYKNESPRQQEIWKEINETLKED